MIVDGKGEKLNDDFRIQLIFNEGPITIEAELSRLLLDNSIQRVYLATAFLTMGGYWAIEEGLRAAIQRTVFVKIVVGTMGQSTDPDAISAVQTLAPGKERIRLYTGKFHPKMYLFQTGALESTLIVGSPNLTDAGLQSNVEAALRLDVSPRSGHYHLINKCIEQFNRWWRDACNRSGGSPLANFKQRSNVPLTLH
jgi:HKD family nuclease